MRLRVEAARRGLSIEDCAVAIIREALDRMAAEEADPAPED
jgi:plasmid stability protein